MEGHCFPHKEARFEQTPEGHERRKAMEIGHGKGLRQRWPRGRGQRWVARVWWGGESRASVMGPWGHYEEPVPAAAFTAGPERQKRGACRTKGREAVLEHVWDLVHNVTQQACSQLGQGMPGDSVTQAQGQEAWQWH